MSEPARHLHVVDADTGEQLDGCPACAYKDDVITGLESEIRSLAAKLTEIKRDKAEAARRDPLWPIGFEVFKAWRILCNHPKSAWNWQRFEAVRPALSDRQYGKTPEERKLLCLRAVVGKSFDCFTKKRANGSLRRFDEFERIFQSYAYTEECANSAPHDWQERLVDATGMVLVEVEAA